MSRPIAPIVCDGPGCTNRKQEANHWWTIDYYFEGNDTTPTISISRGTIKNGAGKLFDACGQDCALKIVSEQMGKVTS